MAEIDSTGAVSGGTGTVTHEAYSFACLSCGYGWEQTYDIDHHLGADGRPMIMYWSEGRRVPSPLTRPVCVNCEGTKLRIMRSGRVTTAAEARGRNH